MPITEPSAARKPSSRPREALSPVTAAHTVTLHGGDTAPSVTADRETLVQLLDRARAAIAPPIPTRGNYAGSMSFVHAVDVPEVDGGPALQCAEDCGGPGQRRRYPVTDGIPVLLADDAVVVTV